MTIAAANSYAFHAGQSLLCYSCCFIHCDTSQFNTLLKGVLANKFTSTILVLIS